MTIGQEIAFHAQAVRRKYGSYPARGSLVPPGLWMPVPVPLEGHEYDEIPPFPDTSEKALMFKPMNRADARQRFKLYRFFPYAKELHRRVNDRRKVS